MLFRPIQGDSWRYYQRFVRIGQESLSKAMFNTESDSLYVLLNWGVGQFGSSPLLLFGATLVIYFGIFIVAIKRAVGNLGLAVLLMCYAAFPFFVAYGASGIRQGLALVFLLLGYVMVRGGARRGWFWLFCAPFWHSGAWLAVVVFVIHQSICRMISRESMRWISVLTAFFLSVLMSVSGINEILMSVISDYIVIKQNYDIYFIDSPGVQYRTGFRLDFFIFSLTPLIVAVIFHRANSFSYGVAGWWLSLYLSLNIIYNLFSFAPYSDRFAAFSWFLMPYIVYLQIKVKGSRSLMTLFVFGVTCLNVIVLQFYTGNFLN